VRDQHFDPSLNGVDWNATREEFLPRIENAASQRALRALLDEMLSRLGQSHFGIIPAEEADASPAVATADELADEGGRAPANVGVDGSRTDAGDAADANDAVSDDAGIAGLDIALVEGVPTVTRVTPGLAAARAGVLVGWEFVAIDGESVEETLEPFRTSLAAEEDPNSPHARQLRMILSSLASSMTSGRSGTSRRAVFRDASGAEQEVSITYEPSPLGSSRFGNLRPFPVEVESRVAEFPVEGGKPVKVGYLSFNIWMTGATDAINQGIDQVRGCDGVVIDLRGNPGGIGAMSMGLAGHFVSEPTSLGSMILRDSTLAFNSVPRKVSAAGKRVRPISRPLAILQDVRSASTSEVFAGGLQAVGRARIFGETSAGMALPSRALELPNGDVLLHAVADFVTSTGTRVEGVGVIPDTEAKLTRSGLLAGKDEVFESAAAWIVERTIASRAEKAEASAKSAGGS
jgi:carboxyl-terminal processing protease